MLHTNLGSLATRIQAFRPKPDTVMYYRTRGGKGPGGD